MTDAILKGIVLEDIRQLQNQWDRIIYLRAALLALAMVSLILAAFNLG